VDNKPFCLQKQPKQIFQSTSWQMIELAQKTLKNFYEPKITRVFIRRKNVRYLALHNPLLLGISNQGNRERANGPGHILIRKK
jgi:hypothetical protein